jgi:TROVE domain-containing protein
LTGRQERREEHMAKFSRKQARPNVTAPVATTGRVMPTHEWGLGYERDAKSELFLLALSNLVKEDSFYEQAAQRDARFVELVHSVTQEDPEWVARFVPYLRNTMQMRSASLVMAAEYLAAGGPNGRKVVASALQRADEPAEMLAYWAQAHGKRFPQPLKRGVADAVVRLYTEWAALKYDGLSRAWRMGDVVDLVHPEPKDEAQSVLFRHLLDRRHDRPAERTGLPVIDAAMALEALPVEGRRAVLDRPEALGEAGMTWERLSGWLQGPMDAQAWEAAIPSMGYMALIRNLRNFEEAGVPATVLDRVAARLGDPEEVARSRQLPIRFYSAWAAIGSVRFGPALEQALDLSMERVPSLPGRTLVLVDVSGSMNQPASARSTVRWWQVAALFGTALAKRAEDADVFAYSNIANRMPVKPTTSVLRAIPEFMAWKGAGGGTQTIDVLVGTYHGHDRVVIVTDEQAFASAADPARIPVPIYTFNVVGYRAGHLPSGQHGRYTFGGLTDAAFTMLPILEGLRDGAWPF